MRRSPPGWLGGVGGSRWCSASTPKTPTANPAAQAGGEQAERLSGMSSKKERVSMVPGGKGQQAVQQALPAGQQHPYRRTDERPQHRDYRYPQCFPHGKPPFFGIYISRAAK